MPCSSGPKIQFDFEGWSTAPAGDLNSDGIDDLIVGSLGYAHYSQGEVVLYLDPDDRGEATARFYSEDPHGHAGIDVTGQMDVNGDGHLDILVSSYENHNVHFNSGLVFVLHGPFAEEEESLFAGEDPADSFMDEDTRMNAGKRLASFLA